MRPARHIFKRMPTVFGTSDGKIKDKKHDGFRNGHCVITMVSCSRFQRKESQHGTAGTGAT